MATITLTGKLSAIATNGSTITKSGSRYVVTGGISMANGAVIDVPLLVDYLEFDGITNSGAVTQIGLINSPSSGDYFPIDVEMTAPGNYTYSTDPFRTRGNITINTYNCTIRFILNGGASAFGLWPGSGVAQTGVNWNAKNVNIIALNSSSAPALGAAEGFPPGGGSLENVTFQGFQKIFFSKSPASTSSVVSVRSTGTQYGFTGDSASFELIGGAADYVSVQRVSTVTLTDFNISGGARITFTDQNLKTINFNRRFAASITGGAGFNYWVWDKNSANVISATLDSSGVLAPIATRFQSLSGSTGSGTVTYTTTQINSASGNLLSPFTVRALGYGYRPLDATHSPDVSVSSVRTPFAVTAIATADLYQSGTQAAALALSSVASISDAYRVFFAWYNSNGAAIHPSTVNLPLGGSTFDFKDWSIVFDTSASTLVSVSVASKTITYKAALIVSGNFTTSGSVTTSGTSISGVYTCSSGTSTSITVSANNTGCRLRLLNNSGTEKYNAVISGTSTILYFPPGSTGTWTGAVELYGYGRQTFSVNVTGGGAFSTSVVMLADSTVSDTLTNVSAYTALDTGQKIRDWIAYYNQTATGIATPLTASLTASSLSIGATTLAKGGTLGYASGVLTTGGTTLSGVNISTTGTQTASKLPTLTYPQQFTDATGTTNWLKVTLDSGQVAQDSYSNAFKTASYTTFLPASYTGTTTLALTARGYKKQVLTIPYSTSLLAAQSVTLIPDSSVSDTTTDFLTTATALTTEQQMYDAYSQWQATSTGILDTYLPTKSPGALDFGSVAATFDPSATETVARGSGTITFKTGAVASGTYYSTGAITVSGATLGDSVKIRASNMDSEIVLNSIDSLRIYPTADDRDSNTNLSFTVSTTVYRFKYGATVSGATMSGTLYTRPSSNGEQSLKDFTLASGNSVFSLSQLGLIQATLAKVNSLPTRDNNQADLAATEKRIVASM